MIRLNAAAANESVTRLLLRFSNTEFQFTDFIARHLGAREFVSLDPNSGIVEAGVRIFPIG